MPGYQRSRRERPSTDVASLQRERESANLSAQPQFGFWMDFPELFLAVLNASAHLTAITGMDQINEPD